MSVISILMVDDHPVVREGYSRLLERQGGFRVCAQADNVAQAYQRYKDEKPDVVIMDLVLQGAGGLEAVRQIREWDQQARVLIFSMHLCAAFALKAFEAGAVAI
jgi:two-component system, NarL family, invasion response regulator UvrY